MFAAPSSNENLVWQCRWLKSHIMFAVPWTRFKGTHRECRLQAMWINPRDIPGVSVGADRPSCHRLIPQVSLDTGGRYGYFAPDLRPHEVSI